MHLRISLNKKIKDNDKDKQIFISGDEKVNCSL